jgi:hypothetical protein
LNAADVRRRVGAEALVIAFCVAVACAWWWPLPLHLLDGQLERPPIDSAYNQWLLGWGAHAITTNPLHYFDANAYHPLTGVLAWGDHLFALALLVVPLRPVLGLVGAYNVLVLASTAGSAYACYLLVRLLTSQRAVAVLAGVVWSCSFYRVLEYSHIQTLSTQWVPLVLLFAEHVRRRCRRWHVVGLAVSAWFVLATNVYLGVYTVLAFGVYAVVVLAARRPDIRTIVRIGFAWFVAGVLALPLYLPGIRLQASRHIVRDIDEQSPATLEAFRLLPPPGQMAQSLLHVIYRSNYATPGLVLAVLLVLGSASVVLLRRSSPTRSGVAFGAVALFALASAQGPAFHWYGRELGDNPVFLAAYHLVPGYDALRIPHRWLLVGFLGLAVAAATLVAPLSARLPRAVRTGLVVALSAMTIVEQAPAPWPVHPSYTTDDEPVYAWLQDQPQRGSEVILELPISADVASAVTQELEAKRLFFSASHFRDRVGGGISPYIEPSYLRNALLVNELGRDPEALAAVRRWDVDLVIFDATDEGRYEGAEPAAAVLQRLDAEPGLQRVTEVGDATVYRVLPRR